MFGMKAIVSGDHCLFGLGSALHWFEGGTAACFEGDEGGVGKKLVGGDGSGRRPGLQGFAEDSPSWVRRGIWTIQVASSSLGRSSATEKSSELGFSFLDFFLGLS